MTLSSRRRPVIIAACLVALGIVPIGLTLNQLALALSKYWIVFQRGR